MRGITDKLISAAAVETLLNNLTATEA